jgi:hypothetical protein
MHDAIRIDASIVAQRIDVLRRTYPELADDEDLLLDALAGETELYEVAERIIAAELEAIVMSNAIRLRRADLSERFDRFERRIDNLRALLKSLMDAAGVERLVLPEATVSITKARESVVITDPDAVPSQLCKIIRQPDKDAIGKALRAGEAIPGAALKFGEAGLTIRTK